MARKDPFFRGTVEKESLTCNVFSRIACIYDLMNHLISFGLIRSWRRRAAQYLPLGAGEVGLDLGTGTAELAIALAYSAHSEGHILGIDITPEMLEMARTKLQRRGLQNRIELRVGDAEHLELPDNSVDSCCSAFLVRNLVDIQQGFREMLRVVRPGGRIVCLEVSHPPGKIFGKLFHYYFYKCAPLVGIMLGQKFEAYDYLPDSLKTFPTAPELKNIMEACGWSDVHFRRLYGGMVAIHSGVKKTL